MLLNKITKLGRYFLAIPMIVFGIQHFWYADFVLTLVPSWIPGGLFWTYLSGVALFAAGIGIFFNILSKLAATLLGLMIFIWIVILHIPLAINSPGNHKEFINIFNAFIICGGAFTLATSLPGNSHLKTIANLGSKAGPFFIAISLMVFGIEHLIFGKLVFIVGADYYPIPGAALWIYLSGIVFIFAAIGILFSKKANVIAALSGIFIFFIVLLFYTPQIATNISFGHAWSTALKGCAMSGSLLILSRLISNEEREVFEYRIPMSQ